MEVLTIIHHFLEADHFVNQPVLETQQVSVRGLTVANPEFSSNIPPPVI